MWYLSFSDVKYVFPVIGNVWYGRRVVHTLAQEGRLNDPCELVRVVRITVDCRPGSGMRET
jgi:hypothetical protein